MALTFSEALSRLLSPSPGRCAHAIGSASIGDDDAWDHLGRQFDDAVRALTAVHGPPRYNAYTFPGIAMDKAAFWIRGDQIVYVLLAYEDNTRIRRLTLGVCDVGRLKVVTSS